MALNWKCTCGWECSLRAGLNVFMNQTARAPAAVSGEAVCDNK